MGHAIRPRSSRFGHMPLADTEHGSPFSVSSTTRPSLERRSPASPCHRALRRHAATHVYSKTSRASAARARGGRASPPESCGHRAPKECAVSVRLDVSASLRGTGGSSHDLLGYRLFGAATGPRLVSAFGCPLQERGRVWSPFS